MADINNRRLEHDGWAHKEYVNPTIQTSWFDLSHSKLLTFDMGELVPTLCMEVVPGDYIEYSSDVLLRFGPMIAPVMHHIELCQRTYFVPNRIIWKEQGNSFTDFITGGEDGANATVRPYVDGSGTYQEGTLGDYLGLPVEVNVGNISALPFRAYAAIYNEYFRNDSVQAAIGLSTDDGSAADATTNQTLQKVNWSDLGDYFVSASDVLQRGTAVDLPLGTSAEVILDTGVTTNKTYWMKLDGTSQDSDEALKKYNTVNENATYGGTSSTLYKFDPNSTLIADLTNATAATIQDIREASATQILYELLEKGGSRYREYVQGIFGVRDYDDHRFQIPEILGGKDSSVVISEVLQTSETASGKELGKMGGHGIAPQQTGTIKRSFKEHGLLMSLMFVRPQAVYQEGLSKMWSRTARLDYLHPQLALIGDQAITTGEIYYDSAGTPTGTFAYTRRYAEYMMHPSSVAGDFRSESDNTLEYWHLARDFAAEPSFNSAFITCSPDNARIFHQSTEDNLYAQVVHYIKARRPLPKEDKPYKLI